jgi:hypothetical protein
MTKSSSTILREYLDILNEGPPPGVGPNAAPKSQQQTMQQRADDIEAGTNQAAQAVDKFSQGNYASGVMDVAKGMNTAANAAGMSFWDKLKAGWIAIKAGVSAATTSGDPMYAAMGSLGKNAADPMAKWINSPTFEKDFVAAIEAARKNPQADAYLKQMVTDYDAKKLTPQSYKAYMQRIIATNAAQQKGQKVDFDADDSYEVKPATESKKTFLDFMEDVEFEGSIVSGDGFIIETGEDEGVETYIIESWDDSILIAADRTTLDILEELGLLGEAAPAVAPGAAPPTAGQPAATTPKMNPNDPNAPIDPLYQKYNQIRGTLQSYQSLTGTQPGDKQTFGNVDPKVTAMIDKMKADMATAEKQLIAKGYTKQQLDATFQKAPAAPQDLSKMYKWDDQVSEAEYQGRNVPLGKPMAGDVKKSKVYVKKPNGKIVKVNFGDKKLSIKKHIPGRRKSFRARHNCSNPGPRWKARYWSCRAW